MPLLYAVWYLLHFHQLLVISSWFYIGSRQPTWPWDVLVFVCIKLKNQQEFWHHRQFKVENLANLNWTSNSEGDKNQEQTRISNHFSSDQPTYVQWGITNPSFWHKGKQQYTVPLMERLKKRTKDSKPRDRNRTLCKQSNMCWRTISSAVALTIRCGVESASSSQGLKTAYRHHQNQNISIPSGNVTILKKKVTQGLLIRWNKVHPW